jgi:glucans biosynthesis protein C
MTQRHHFIDWLRVLAFLLLIFYHTAMLFNNWGWHIKNPELSANFEIWMELINPWRLPLLFFISGVGVSFATRNRSIKNFVKERITRLLIPLVFGMLIIIPPQIYIERLVSGAFTGSYLRFYSKVFEFEPYPAGNFSWHHLWFVMYILVFSLAAVPFIKYLRNKELLASKWSTIVIILPLSLCYLLLRDSWPTTNNLVADWFNLSFSFFIFMIGYLFGNQANIWERLERKRYQNLGFGVFLILFSLFFDWYFGELSEDFLWVRIFNSLYKITFIFCVILGLFGFSKKYLNFENPFLKYANRAVYPFYILHQTIIIILGYFWLNWHIAIWLKFLIISFLTTFICLLIYHFFIKNWKLSRLLLGVK